MGPLGWPETDFIFFLALILFGPKKLPELGRTVGKALTEFRRASNELKSTFDREIKSLEQESEIKEFKEITNQYQSDTYNYDYSSYDSHNYEGAYEGETHDSTATTPPTISASATQDAESTAAVPEGAAAPGSETAAVPVSSGPESLSPAPNGHAAPAPTAEHNA